MHGFPFAHRRGNFGGGILQGHVGDGGVVDAGTGTADVRIVVQGEEVRCNLPVPVDGVMAQNADAGVADADRQVGCGAADVVHHIPVPVQIGRGVLPAEGVHGIRMGRGPAGFVEDFHGKQVGHLLQQGQNFVQKTVTAVPHIRIGEKVVVGDHVIGVFQKPSLAGGGVLDFFRFPEPSAPVGAGISLAVEAAFRFGKQAQLQLHPIHPCLFHVGPDLVKQRQIYPPSDVQPFPGRSAGIPSGKHPDHGTAVLFGIKPQNLLPDRFGGTLEFDEGGTVL